MRRCRAHGDIVAPRPPVHQYGAREEFKVQRAKGKGQDKNDEKEEEMKKEGVTSFFLFISFVAFLSRVSANLPASITTGRNMGVSLLNGMNHRPSASKASFTRRTTVLSTLTRAHSLLSASTSTHGAASLPVFSIISHAAAT